MRSPADEPSGAAELCRAGHAVGDAETRNCVPVFPLCGVPVFAACGDPAEQVGTLAGCGCAGPGLRGCGWWRGSLPGVARSGVAAIRVADGIGVTARAWVAAVGVADGIEEG